MCGDCKHCKRVTISALQKAGFFCMLYSMLVDPGDSGCDDEVKDDGRGKITS